MRALAVGLTLLLGGHALAQVSQKACDDGAADDCAILDEGGEKSAKDWAQTARLHRLACGKGERGNPFSCLSLQWLYENGKGVPRDKAKALRLQKRACALGEPMTCRELGEMYERGEGVARDKAQAARFYEMSCVYRERWGCALAGRLYEEGDGVSRDKAKAEKLYDRACDGGNKWGCVRLWGVRDAAESAAMLEPQSLQNDCDPQCLWCCAILGAIHEHGKGVPRDMTKAMQNYQRACDLGDWGSCLHLAKYRGSYRQLQGICGKGEGVPGGNAWVAQLYQQACSYLHEPGFSD